MVQMDYFSNVEVEKEPEPLIFSLLFLLFEAFPADHVVVIAIS